MFRILKSREMDTLNRTLAEVQELRSEISGLREHLGRILPPGVDMLPEDDGEGFVYNEKGDPDGQMATETTSADMVADAKVEEAPAAASGGDYREQAACRDKSEKEDSDNNGAAGGEGGGHSGLLDFKLEPEDIEAAEIDFTAEEPETEELYAGAAGLKAVGGELPPEKEILAVQVKKDWAVVKYPSRNKLWRRFWSKKTSLF